MGRRGRGRCAVRLSHARRRGTSSGRASFAQPEGITFPVLHGPHVSARGPTTVSPDRARRHMRVPAPHVPMQYLLPPMLHLVRTPATMLLRRFALCALVLCVCALRVLALYRPWINFPPPPPPLATQSPGSEAGSGGTFVAARMPAPPGWAPDPLMGWWDSACASHPGVLGSIPKRWRPSLVQLALVNQWRPQSYGCVNARLV